MPKICAVKEGSLIHFGLSKGKNTNGGDNFFG